MTKKECTQLFYLSTGCAMKVHKIREPDLLESVSEKCLKYELESRSFKIKQQTSIQIQYEVIEIDSDLRIDLLDNDCFGIELKAIDTILPIHQAQLKTYLKLPKVPQGLLINFNVLNIIHNFKPFVNEYFNSLKDL